MREHRTGSIPVTGTKGPKISRSRAVRQLVGLITRRSCGSNPTSATKKERTFVYQMKVRSFHIFGTFQGKIRQIKGKIRKITRCSGHRDCRSVIFMPAAAQKSTLLFVVLCSNKEQQKHCVVRELNQNYCQVCKTRTILPPLPLYKPRELCYTYSV